jgi:hypothetical protein
LRLDPDVEKPGDGIVAISGNQPRKQRTNVCKRT